MGRVYIQYRKRTEIAYKIRRQLNSQEKDTAHHHIINSDTWIEHYSELWTEQEDPKKHKNENHLPNLTIYSDT